MTVPVIEPNIDYQRIHQLSQDENAKRPHRRTLGVLSREMFPPEPSYFSIPAPSDTFQSAALCCLPR
jgi:hypothetical protein